MSSYSANLLNDLKELVLALLKLAAFLILGAGLIIGLWFWTTMTRDCHASRSNGAMWLNVLGYSMQLDEAHFMHCRHSFDPSPGELGTHLSFQLNIPVTDILEDDTTARDGESVLVDFDGYIEGDNGASYWYTGLADAKLSEMLSFFADLVGDRSLLSKQPAFQSDTLHVYKTTETNHDGQPRQKLFFAVNPDGTARFLAKCYQDERGLSSVDRAKLCLSRQYNVRPRLAYRLYFNNDDPEFVRALGNAVESYMKQALGD